MAERNWLLLQQGIVVLENSHMASELKFNTQQDIVIGPIVSSTDFGLKTDLAYNAAGIAVNAFKYDGTAVTATLANSAGDWYWRHDANGYYLLTVPASTCNPCGNLTIAVKATGILPCWEKFVVKNHYWGGYVP
jgi:hypothetical protein